MIRNYEKRIFTLPKIFNENEHIGLARLDFNEESDGTKKFMGLSGPILDTLKEAKVLIIDELEASLHPLLTEYLVKLFQDKTINIHKAQLIFATHDVNLLRSQDLFAREQVWFTEKDSYGATHLYSLLEYKIDESRKDISTAVSYLQGRYGATPKISHNNWFKELKLDGQE